MLRIGIGSVVFLVATAGVVAAADPTVAWDNGSPSAAAGPRIVASGTYTIPAPAGGVSYELSKIKIEYKPNNDSTWTSKDSTVNQTNKTFQFLSDVLPQGLYNVRIRMEVTKTSGNPPQAELIIIEAVPTTKNVTL